MGIGTGTSIFLIAVGAILDFAVKVSSSTFDIQTVGLILMIVGAVGLVVSLFTWGSWGGGFRRRSVVRDRNGTVVEERSQSQAF